jgi:hypothetical protein
MTILLAAILVPAGVEASQEPRSFELTIEAGGHDRKNTPVRLPAPEGFAGMLLRNAAGEIVSYQVAPSPLQGSGRPEVVFIVAELKSGRTETFKALPADSPRPTGTFAWERATEGQMELSFERRAVLRYMHQALDESSKEARDRTNKVFHHLYDPAGTRFVTNGAGGRYPHHRGIFYGWNQVTYGAGKRIDVWHCPKGHQSHQGFLATEQGPVLGRHRVQVGWHGEGKELFASEERELSAYHVPGGILVEFASRLVPVISPIKLDGDPQHAGFHFRADNEVNDKTAKQTVFVRPDGAGKPGETRNWPAQKGHANLPWNAMSFVLGDKRYTVAYLDHPQNPKESRYSERDYGRFGSYFEYTLEAGKTLDVRYRLWLQEGEMKPDEVARLSADFVDPPRVTVK